MHPILLQSGPGLSKYRSYCLLGIIRRQYHKPCNVGTSRGRGANPMIPDSSQVKPYSRRGGRSRRDALLIGLLLLVNLVFVSVYLSGRAQKEQRKRRQERQWRLQAQTTLDAAQRRDAAYSAARRGDETAFRAAMAGLSDQDKRVLLAAFAQDGDLKTLRIWFQAGWPVGREALDDAMVRAATFQRPEVVRLLLKHHASPEATTQIYFTALTMACSHPASETAHILIQAGADVNRKMMWM